MIKNRYVIQNTKYLIPTFWKKRAGQSLAEVMIGLAIGAILIGAASFAITTTLKTNLSSQRSQFAANAAQETIERVRAFASADWQNVYGLTKASSTQYYFVATGTQFFVNQGKEGLIENDIRNGLVGQWGFDEATGTIAYDGTGNKNIGTFSGSVAHTTSTCKMGFCITTSGSSGTVNLGSSTLFNSSAFSFSMWINPSVINAGDQYNNIILGRESYTTSGFRFGIRNSGKPLFWTSQSGGTVGLESSIPITVNTFSNIILTYSSSTVTMYINGTFAGTGSGSYVTPTGVQLVVNGGIGGTQSSNSAIDDFRVYNRVLSADEVKQLYNSATYTRYFYVENGCRTNDASSTYSGVAPCGGGSIDDPSSQKISSVVQWGTGLGTGQIILADILTRWKNAIFQQSDWSGGVSGSVLINSGTTFASSTNVNSGGGSLRINGL